MLKRIAVALLALALALSCAVATAEDSADPTAYIGRQLLDFTVETADGGSFTLYEALEDHQLALINLWATWCGYCTMEFPYLQEAYEEYADRVAVLALSVWPDDTLEVISDYAGKLGLTFPMGSDTDFGLGSIFARNSIPVSILVDHEGYIAYVSVGAMPSADAFKGMFNYFLDQMSE